MYSNLVTFNEVNCSVEVLIDLKKRLDAGQIWLEKESDFLLRKEANSTCDALTLFSIVSEIPVENRIGSVTDIKLSKRTNEFGKLNENSLSLKEASEDTMTRWFEDLRDPSFLLILESSIKEELMSCSPVLLRQALTEKEIGNETITKILGWKVKTNEC